MEYPYPAQNTLNLPCSPPWPPHYAFRRKSAAAAPSLRVIWFLCRQTTQSWSISPAYSSKLNNMKRWTDAGFMLDQRRNGVLMVYYLRWCNIKETPRVPCHIDQFARRQTYRITVDNRAHSCSRFPFDLCMCPRSLYLVVLILLNLYEVTHNNLCTRAALNIGSFFQECYMNAHMNFVYKGGLRYRIFLLKVCFMYRSSKIWGSVCLLVAPIKYGHNAFAPCGTSVSRHLKTDVHPWYWCSFSGLPFYPHFKRSSSVIAHVVDVPGNTPRPTFCTWSPRVPSL